MTRDEEIKDALNMYAPSAWGMCGETIPMNQDELAASHKGFIRGARWADKHPKSPWISVGDDLPCNHEELIQYKGKHYQETIRVLVRADCKGYVIYRLATMEKHFEQEWDWNIDLRYEVTHWILEPKVLDD